jgi:hypothetical protein
MMRVACGALLLLAVLGITGARGGEWQGQELEQDGMLVIHNPADPMEPPTRLSPTEVWRLGGASQADEEIFGRVENIIVDESGEVYLLDSQLNEIRVFSPTGEYLRSVGRVGEGPGEFRNAILQFLLPDERLGVVQMMPTRVAVIGLDGTAHSDLPLPFEGSGMLFVQRVQSQGDRIVLSCVNPIMAPDGVEIRRTLAAVNTAGEVVTTIKETSEKQAGGRISISTDSDENFFGDWVLGPDGYVYVAPYRQQYQVFVFDPDGGRARIIKRDYESRRRTDEELAALEAELDRQSEEYGGDPDEINPLFPDVDRVVPRDGGELWVLSSHGIADPPNGTVGTFDVYDASGHYVRNITIEADYDQRYDDFAIVGDRLFVLKEARSASDQVSSGSAAGGGQMTMIRRGGSRQSDDRDPEPFAVVCYQLSPES